MPLSTGATDDAGLAHGYCDAVLQHLTNSSPATIRGLWKHGLPCGHITLGTADAEEGLRLALETELPYATDYHLFPTLVRTVPHPEP